MKALLHCTLVFFSLAICIASSQVYSDVRAQVELQGEVVGDRNVYRKIGRPGINCNFACSRRCMEASRTNVCMRACGTCCLRCQCVPAGTYGNHGMCPCYANLRTHGGRLKCP